MTTFTAGSDVEGILAATNVRLALWAALALVVTRLLPVLATTLVLTWHAFRATTPGPAAQQLLTLVRMLWVRGRRR
jgi:hypothetical protein